MIFIQPFLNLINEKAYLIFGQNIDFFVLLFIVIVLSFLLEKIWIKILKKSYPYFLIFGIAIHELSHFFACLLTGATIHDTRLTLKKGGYVKHDKSKIPIVGNIIISFAPIVGGIATIFVIYLLLDFSPIIISFDPQKILSLIQSWQFWIGFYLITSVLITLIPSWQDVKNALIGLFFIFLFFILLSIIGKVNIFNLLNHQMLINTFYSAIIIQISILLLSLPFYFLKLITIKLKK